MFQPISHWNTRKQCFIDPEKVVSFMIVSPEDGTVRNKNWMVSYYLPGCTETSSHDSREDALEEIRRVLGDYAVPEEVC